MGMVSTHAVQLIGMFERSSDERCSNNVHENKKVKVFNEQLSLVIALLLFN